MRRLSWRRRLVFLWYDRLLRLPTVYPSATQWNDLPVGGFNMGAFIVYYILIMGMALGFIDCLQCDIVENAAKSYVWS